jgi:hypothetical protein
MEQATEAGKRRRRHRHEVPRHKRFIRRVRRRLGPGRFRQIIVLMIMLGLLALICYLFMQKVTQPPPMPPPE